MGVLAHTSEGQVRTGERGYQTTHWMVTLQIQRVHQILSQVFLESLVRWDEPVMSFPERYMAVHLFQLATVRY